MPTQNALFELFEVIGALFCVLSAAVSPLLLRDFVIRARWKRAAQKLGLHFRPGSLMGGDRLSGQVRGHAIDIDNANRQKTRFVLSAPNRIPAGVHLKRADFFAPWDRDQSLATGDRAFDRHIAVRGPREIVTPLLDRRARNALLDVLERRSVDVQGSCVHCTLPQVVKRAPDLEVVMSDLVHVAGALELAIPVADKLRLNATSPDEPRVFRLANLEILLERFPDSLSARTACRALLQSRDAEERLRAAIGLGADREALDTVRGIALADAIPAEYRVRALRHLATAADGAEIESILVTCAKNAQEEVRATALSIAAEMSLSSAPALILDALALYAEEPAPLIAAAEGVRKLRPVEAPDWKDKVESALIGALRSDHAAVRIAVADALGAVGTLRAVEPLVPLSRALLIDFELKRAAREAIRAIQKRLPQAESGRLSILAYGEEGDLSLIEAGDGRLSLAERVRRSGPEPGPSQASGATASASPKAR